MDLLSFLEMCGAGTASTQVQSMPLDPTSSPRIKHSEQVRILQEQYLAGATIAQLAERYERSTKWVRTRLVAADTPMRRPGRAQQASDETIRERYRALGSVRKVGAELGCVDATINRALGNVPSGQTTPESDGRPREEWPAERVESELRAFIDKHDLTVFPTSSQLNAARRYALRKAILRTGGTTRWAAIVGLPVSRRGPKPSSGS